MPSNCFVFHRRLRIFIAFGKSMKFKHITTPSLRLFITFLKKILRAKYFVVRGRHSYKGYAFNFWPMKQLASLSDVSVGQVRRQGPEVFCSVRPSVIAISARQNHSYTFSWKLHRPNLTNGLQRTTRRHIPQYSNLRQLQSSIERNSNLT